MLDQKAGDPNRDEIDGLDETLVPYDASKQGGGQDIRDDELFAFVDKVCSQGKTKLWFVLDCCHSGSGVRGSTKFRKLTRRSTPSPLSVNQEEVVTKRLPPGAVFLSACQADELEPEYDCGGAKYGLLTRFLVQSLNETPALKSFTYKELRRSIVSRYRENRVASAPTPTLEFGDSDSLNESIVDGVGLDRKPSWPILRIGKKRNEVLLKAGLLQGVAVGSIYELYQLPDEIVWNSSPESTNNGDSVCWLKVEKAEGNSAVCRVFEWTPENQESDFKLKSSLKQGFAVERFHNNSAAIRIKVVKSLSAGNDSSPLKSGDKELPSWIEGALNPKTGESNWIQWIEDDSPSDILVRTDGNQFASLFPANGGRGRSTIGEKKLELPDGLRGGWGPVDGEKPEPAKQLRLYFRKIAKAQNLISLVAQRNDEGSKAEDENRVDVSIGLLKVEEGNNEGEILKSTLWKTSEAIGESNPNMQDGDKFGFVVTNREQDGKPVYVTVLKVNSDMEIDQVHPYQPQVGVVEGEQMLEAGRSLQIPGYWVCNGSKPKNYGENWVIVLATREKNDFYLLAQSGLPHSRGIEKSSGLESLLLEYTEMRTRNSRKRPVKKYDESWGAAVIRWNVVPAK